MSTHNLCFEQKYEKYKSFFVSENFPFFFFFCDEIILVFEKACFRYDCLDISNVV